MAKQEKQEITLDIITRAKEGDEKARNQLAGWITGAKAGDKKARNQLAGSIHDFVRNKTKVSARQTRDNPSDIAQDVAMAIIAKLGKFKGKSVDDFQGWVDARATLRKKSGIRDANRQKRNIKKQQPYVGVASHGTEKVTSHSKTFENRELAERAMVLLYDRSNFTDEAREILVSRIFGEIPVAKIAKRRGTTTPQVDSAFRRNLAKLLELLQNEELANASRKTPSPEQDRLAKLGFAYLRACESGNGPHVDAFLANVRGLDDETLQTLELFREFRSLAFGPDNEE